MSGLGHVFQRSYFHTPPLEKARFARARCPGVTLEGRARRTRDPVPLAPTGGDHLTRDEFDRRYEAMPHIRKAELVEGVVYLPSPVRLEQHGGPHATLIWWLSSYRAFTPGVRVGGNATVRLDLDTSPSPTP